MPARYSIRSIFSHGHLLGGHEGACSSPFCIQRLALIVAQPILLSRIASFMTTWLEISQSASGNNKIGHRSAAVFLIKNDDTCRTMPPLPAVQVPDAKSVWSAAISQVSSWMKRSERTLQSQESNISEHQVSDESFRAETKRVPRSQRLGTPADALGSAGACTLFATIMMCKRNLCIAFQVTLCLSQLKRI